MRGWTWLTIAALAGATPAMAQMGGGDGGMMRGGPPPEADSSGGDAPAREIGSSDRMAQMKPLARAPFDKAVAAMFALADTNRDGTVTLAELQAVIEARRDTIIRDRFREIDTNRDGRIDENEFIAWQGGMGAAAASQCAGAVGARELVPETLGPPLGRGERDTLLAAAIEPLSANLITNANIHYGPGITLAELTAYEGARFDKLDTNHDGFLEQGELAVGGPLIDGERAGRPGGSGSMGGRHGGGMGGPGGGMGRPTGGY